MSNVEHSWRQTKICLLTLPLIASAAKDFFPQSSSFKDIDEAVATPAGPFKGTSLS